MMALDRLVEQPKLTYDRQRIVRGGDALADYLRNLISELEQWNYDLIRYANHVHDWSNPSDFTMVSGDVVDHNTLSSLQGGSSTERYHLTSAQVSSVGLSHNAVTLGTANGLSLSGQQLSLPTSSTPQFAKVNIDGASAYIDTDGSGNITLTDAVVGTRTAANLSTWLAGIWDCGTSDVTLDSDVTFDCGYSL